MASDELTALVALLREGGRAWARYVVALRAASGTSSVSAQALLERELGLLAYEAQGRASAEIEEWRRRGYRLLSITDPAYPSNLSVVANRPPLLFVAGELTDADANAVAVIGTRHPSEDGLRLAAEVATALGDRGYSVVSGLAAGIDTCVHLAALHRGTRTLAVIGTGLDHVYPPQNVALQKQVAREGAVVSQLWPENPGSRQSFPARNALMSGLSLASVVVEASSTSGTRIQARQALHQGRQVILMQPTLINDWAREMAQRPGVLVAETASDVLRALGR